MSGLNAFWSYVHKDNEAEKNRIRELAEDISEEFGIKTTEKVSNLFHDGEIPWGDNWRQVIDENLNNLAFCIPIITPRFFISQECRRELEYILNRAKEYGLTGILLPILYVDVPALFEEVPGDPLVLAIKTIQWKDWRKLRPKPRDSEEYKVAVIDIVDRLIDANKKIERRIENETRSTYVSKPSLATQEPAEEKPGVLDSFVEMESNMDKLPKMVEQFKIDMGKIQTIFTSENNSTQSKLGLNASVRAAKKISVKLTPVVDRIVKTSQDYNNQIQIMDLGIQGLFDIIENQLNTKQPLPQAFTDLLKSISTSEPTLEEANIVLEEAVTQLTPYISISRDLRAPLRKLIMGLTIFSTALATSLDWSKRARGYLKL